MGRLQDAEADITSYAPVTGALFAVALPARLIKRAISIDPIESFREQQA